jgi:hypothetical protein
MKTIVRSIVVVLALTGAIATTATPASSASVAAVKASAMPQPRCPLNSPDGCGFNNW